MPNHDTAMDAATDGTREKLDGWQAEKRRAEAKDGWAAAVAPRLSELHRIGPRTTRRLIVT